MQSNRLIFFKKYHIIFILLYIFAFSLLLFGMYHFCRLQENTSALQPGLASATEIKTDTTISSVKETPQQIQSNIAKSILRLHVIAHSDTDADQKLKLAVRDEIITSLQSALQNATSTAQAAEIIMTHKTQIEKSAYRVLSRYNSSYTVNVSLGERYFPIKQYGDLVFPAGTYQALCVEIGKAEGRNWWCVLFPSLCFLDETTATVPDESKEKLKDSLSEEEYQALTPTEANTTTDNSRPEIRFGVIDWFQAHVLSE